jgi:hypothetical protein
MELHDGVLRFVHDGIADESRRPERISREEHRQRRIDIALAGAHESKVVELAEREATARFAHARRTADRATRFLRSSTA